MEVGAAERFLFGDAPTWEVPTFWRQGSAGGHRRKGTAASKRRQQASSAPPGKLGRAEGKRDIAAPALWAIWAESKGSGIQTQAWMCARVIWGCCESEILIQRVWCGARVWILNRFPRLVLEPQTYWIRNSVGNPQAVSEQVILVSRVLKPRLGKYLSFSEPQVP